MSFLGEENELEAAAILFDRAHRCQYCERSDFTHKSVDVRDGICEECEESRAFCWICNEWMPDDCTCRHLIYVDDEGWGGSGGGDVPDNQFRVGLKALLSMYPAFAQPLADGLLESRYYFGFSGSIFGWDNITIDLPQHLPRDFMRELFSGDMDDWKASARLGLSWLVSLWDGRGDWP